MSVRPKVIVDSRGIWCPPTPLIDLFKAYRYAKSGDKIELWASEPDIEADVKAWAAKTGNTVVSVTPRSTFLRILVEVTSKRKLNR
jgi:TusA-related sulfurtransferase